MEGSKDKQTGFSIVEALVAVVAVCALAALSWAVYQHVKGSATTTGAEANPNQSTSQNSTSPVQAVAYLDIKEWGIKIPLSDAIKDAYYVPSVQNRAADGTPLAMYIGLKSLDATGCDANSANIPGGRGTALGIIIRINPTDVDHVSGVEYVKEWPSVTIGSYAYAFDDGTKNRTCAPATSLQSISSAFTNAIQTTSAATAN